MKTIAQQIKWDFKTNGDLIIRDKNGKLIYREFSDGVWGKYERDSQGTIGLEVPFDLLCYCHTLVSLYLIPSIMISLFSQGLGRLSLIAPIEFS